MAISNGSPDVNLLSKAIKDAIERQAEREFERLKEDLVKRLEEQKSDIIGGVAIDVMKLVSFETIRQELVITIRNQRV